MTTDTKIEPGTFVTFTAADDTQKVGKVQGTTTEHGTMFYVIATKSGAEYLIEPEQIVSVGKPMSARDHRKRAQHLLSGKHGMTKAEQLDAVDKAILALQEAYQILEAEAQEEKDAQIEPEASTEE